MQNETKQLRTHKVVEAMTSPTGFFIRPQPDFHNDQKTRDYTQAWAKSVIDDLLTAEQFLLPGSEELDAEDFEAIEKSSQALAEAGCFHLPFPTCVVEMNGMTYVMHEHEDGMIDVQVFVPKDGTLYVMGMLTELRPIEYRPDDWRLECTGKLNYKSQIDLKAKSILEDHTEHCGEVVCTLVVLLMTRGIRRERITGPEKLNKQRLRKGKPTLRDYTRVYIRPPTEAEVREYQEGDEDRPKRASPRLHLRRGYTRTRLGNKEWIAPTLVGRESLGRIKHKEYVVPGLKNNYPAVKLSQ